MASRRPAKPNQQPPAEVRAAISRLREVYAQGQEILAACPPGKWHRIAEEARSRRIHTETARDMRKLAQRYTPEQFEALCLECERHGRALGPSYVFAFLVVRDLRERRKFQNRVIREGWSLARVDSELRRGKRAGKGRTHKMPATVEDACAWLERRSQSWLRWLEGLDPEEEPEDQITMAELPGDLQRHLIRLRKVLEAVQDRATEHLRQAEKRPSK